MKEKENKNELELEIARRVNRLVLVYEERYSRGEISKWYRDRMISMTRRVGSILLQGKE